LNDSSAATAAANKGYVDAEIAAAVGEITAAGVSYEVVEALPEGEDIKSGYIYLLKDDAEGSNVYEEYMYINGKWEVIGTTVTDLEGKASLSGASFTGAVTVPVLGEGAGDLTVTNKGYVDGAATAAKEAAEATTDSKATAAKDAAIAAAASDATTKAGTAKSEAIATASSDATTKANTAKSEAIATAAADATAKANAAQTTAETNIKAIIGTAYSSTATVAADIASVKTDITNNVKAKYVRVENDMFYAGTGTDMILFNCGTSSTVI
jgi:hypothetical protein